MPRRFRRVPFSEINHNTEELAGNSQVEAEEEYPELRQRRAEFQSWSKDIVSGRLMGKRAQFQQRMKMLITCMMCCAFCGNTNLGTGLDKKMKLIDPLGQVAPYALANVFMAQYVMKNGKWVVCNLCANLLKRGQRASHTVYVPPEYSRKLFSVDQLKAQLLSCVDVSVQLTESWGQFSKGTVQRGTLLNSPLVIWQTAGDTVTALNAPALENELGPLIAENLIRNPIIQKFKTLLEVGKHEYGVPVISSECLGRISRNHILRGPMVSMEHNAVRGILATLTFPQLDALLVREKSYSSFVIGDVYFRDQTETRGITQPLVVYPNGLETMSQTSLLGVTLEKALFPFLFPHGTGAFNGDYAFFHYCSLRFAALFSVFTLFKPYVLIMYMLRRSLTLIGAMRQVVYQKDMDIYKRKHPDATEEQVYLRTIKHIIPGTVAGTPKWHRNQLSDLLNMCENFGLPDFFLTLTADEVSVSRFEELEDIERMAKMFSEQMSWNDCPLECSKAFHERLRVFMKNYILCKDEQGILGRVLHYVTRYEVQMRGSVHAHILLWIDKNDVERVTNEICAFIPGKVDENTGLIEPHDDEIEQRMYDLVTQKQMHRCRIGGCKEDESAFCRYGFPGALNSGPQTTFDTQNMRYRYYRPRRQDHFVVPYHPSVLFIWGAHMNLQRVTNTGWSKYLLKYAMKSEPQGMLNLDPENAASLGFQRGNDTGLSESDLKLLSGYLLSKPVTLTEAGLYLQNINIVKKDTTVVDIDSRPLTKRRWNAQSNRFIRTVFTADVHKYCARHPRLSNLTFYQYFSQYRVLKKGKRGAPHSNDENGSDSEDEDAGQAQEFPDSIGFIARRMRSLEIAKFTDFHPVHQLDEYFYNVLLQNICFRSVDELISPANIDKSYYMECRMRDLVNEGPDGIEEHLDKYAEKHLQTDEQRQRLFEDFMNKCNNDSSMFSPNEDPADPGTHPQQDTLEELFPSEYIPPETEVLTPAQQLEFESIVNAESGLHKLSGGPGSGKTFLTKYIIRHFRRSGKRVLVCASTGAAASRLEKTATTFHSAFGIPRAGVVPDLDPGCSTFQRILQAQIIIIDEFSMLTGKLFTNFFLRRQTILRCESMEQVLQSGLFIVVGDHKQLPAVCHHNVRSDVPTVCAACHISASPWWKYGIMHNLPGSQRHNDDLHITFLNHIRNNIPSPEFLNEHVPASIRISERDAMRVCDHTAVFLCSHNEDVQMYNVCMLNKLFPPESIFLTPIRGSAVNEPSLSDWCKNDGRREPFHTLKAVGLGARVMLTANLDLKKGACNGAFGTVTCLEFEAENVIDLIHVKFDATGETMKIASDNRRSCWHNQKHFSKTAFPLTLAYAITVHKSQGATFRNWTIIHMRSGFAPGLAYVAFSRVPGHAKLRVVDNVTPEMFVPMPDM